MVARHGKMNTFMVAAFAIAASAAVAAVNATKTLTLPGNFPCGTTVKGPCSEQQLDPATGEARLLFGGLSP